MPMASSGMSATRRGPFAAGWLGSVFGPRLSKAKRTTGVRRRTPATPPNVRPLPGDSREPSRKEGGSRHTSAFDHPWTTVKSPFAVAKLMNRIMAALQF